MFFRKWREERKEKREFVLAVAEIEHQVVQHMADGGTLESLLTVPLFEDVLWSVERQKWYVDVVEGGASYTGGSIVVNGEKLSRGQRVSMMSGRGGRMEDALVVSGKKISGGYTYYLDFEATGGATPWFASLMR